MCQCTIDASFPSNVTETENLIHDIVEAVADAGEIDPTELPPLYNTIDPDALNALFRSSEMEMTAALSYHGYDIIVHSGGDITVDKK